MDIELENKLKEKYKWLSKMISNKHPYPMFGIEVGDGWYNLLDDLCFHIDRVLIGDSGIEKNFYVAQIKEKFGGLRFYIYGGDDEIDGLIHNAEDKSFTICEVCGNKGKPNKKGWISTLCESCREKREQEKE